MDVKDETVESGTETGTENNGNVQSDIDTDKETDNATSLAESISKLLDEEKETEKKNDDNVDDENGKTEEDGEDDDDDDNDDDDDDDDNDDDDDDDDEEEENEIDLSTNSLLLLGDPIPLPLKLGSDMPSYRNPTNLKPRCGLMKVKVAQLLQMMICCRYPSINAAVVELGLVQRLWNLFFLHERNNTLHCAVAQATLDILDSTSMVLKRNLLGTELEDCNLITNVLESFERNDAEIMNGNGRLCYMGHISMCAFELSRSTDVIVREALINVGGIRWEKFNIDTLEPLTKLDQQNLGDPVPQPPVPEAPDHQMLLENLTAILSSLRLSN